MRSIVFAWQFPKAIGTIWDDQSEAQKLSLITHCLQNRSFPPCRNAIQKIAAALRTRESTVAGWPADRIAGYLLHLCDAKKIDIEPVFRSHFFQAQIPLMSAFLDSLRIPHKAGIISSEWHSPPDVRELEEAVAQLLKKFPSDEVSLYTQVLVVTDETNWGKMRQINFTNVESLVALPNPVPASPADEVDRGSSSRPEAILMFDSESNDQLVWTVDGPEQAEDHEDLDSSLDRIRVEFSRAAKQLEADLCLVTQGTLPSEDVSRIFATLKTMHGNLLNKVRVRADAHGISHTLDACVSLDRLSEIVAKIKKLDDEKLQQRGLKQQAICLLDSVISLSRADGREFSPLTACQDSARDLRSRFLRPELELDEEILRALKPYELLMLVTTSEPELDEDRSLDALESIGKQFGGKLAFALSKRLITAQLSPGDRKSEEIQERDEQAPTYVITSAEGTKTFEQLDLNSCLAEAPTEATAIPDTEVTSSNPAVIVDEHSAAEIPAGTGFASPTVGDTPSVLQFRYSDADNAASLAAGFLKSEDPRAPESIERLIWLVLLEGKVGIAYHLVQALERGHPHEYVQLLSSLRALALGRQFQKPLGSIAEQLREDFGLIAISSDFYSSPDAAGHRLLLIASGLRAAVVDPSTDAHGAIEIGIHDLVEAPELCRICKLISEYASLRVPLDPIALELVGNSENSSEHIGQLRKEALSWWSQAPHIRFTNPYVEKIWTKWLEFDGSIHRLVTPIFNRDIDALVQQKRLLESFSTEGRIRGEANATERQLRGRAMSGNLSAGNMTTLIRYVREAVDFATRWIALQEHGLPEQLNYSRKKLLELYSSLTTSRAEVEAELEAVSEASDDLRVRAGARQCRLALENLLVLLKPHLKGQTREPEVRYVLSGDLLCIPGLRLSEAWEPTAEPDIVIERLLKELGTGSPCEWRMAFQYFCDRRWDHAGTDRILEFLKWSGDQNELVTELSGVQRDHIRQCQNTLKRQLEDCSKNIEGAVVLGLVRETERARFLDVLEEIKKGLPATRDFGKEKSRIALINTEIETSRKHLVAGLRKRLDQEAISPGSSEFERIAELIEKGDVHTANEYIDLAVRGDQLPEAPNEFDHLATFFPYCAADIDAFLGDPKKSGSLLNRVASGKGLPGVEMRNVPEAQAQEAVEMLEAWIALRKAKRALIGELRIVFTRLGFEVEEIGPSTNSPRGWIPIKVTPIVHKNQCPVPYFGSMANGRYRVLCVFDRLSEEEIVNQIRTGRQGTPPVVLYFGRLTESKRRYLAQLSRAEQLSFIFIDELLLTYLCGHHGSRLPVMFQCALPFAFVNPYTTTASNVPPEMFYGRRTERTQIMDPMGSCFVYGGRQLGKTALLLSIRAEFHDPSQGRIALWIDLKALGSTQDDIWIHLIRSLKEIEDVELHIKEIRSEQKLFERLQDWLNKDESRQILILLDEADRFLESDSKDGFPRTSILKGWMEKTNRRFKVVFAGLHNVQRTTRQQNHPLAHFGEPICIGPLLDGGEWKEAIGLIERPLWNMGFRFESRDLVMRILSQTNYYPSLIQLYCNQLFLYLARDNANQFDWRTSPPYVITAKHVEDAYAPLRGKIRERFELTLNLDVRYRVIALIIALHSLSEGRVSSELLTVEKIQANAFVFWKQGFEDCTSRDDFAVLLEEMVGLGVLREIEGQYALRTPNLLTLLGTEEEIEAKLLKTSEESAPAPFMPSVFRSSDQIWKRNPLTVLQEGDLHAEKHAVTLIVGSKAAGLDDLESFLARSFEGSLERWDSELSERNGFRRKLDDLQDRLRQGITLTLIQNNPWTLSWLEETIGWSKKKGEKAVSRFCNFAFVADPESMWRLVHDRSALEELITKRSLNTISLQPWHSSVLRQWLGDCQIGSNAAEEEIEIAAKTGNWPILLFDFRTRVVTGHRWQAALAETYESVTNLSTNARLLEAFGLHIPETYKVLNELAQLGGQASIAEMIELLDPLPEQMVRNVVFWADRLSLVKRAASSAPDEDQWALNSIIKDLLLSRHT
jgi:hypothetical protein